MQAMIRQKVSQAVDIADELGLIKRAEDFRKYLAVYISDRQGMNGGIKGGRPLVRLSTRDRWANPRAFMQRYSDSFGDILPVRMKSNWRRAVTIFRKTGQVYNPEYSSFDTDPVIGGFISDSPEMAYAVAVAHEVAHAIHWFNWWHGPRASRPKPHGDEWKAIYRAIRTRMLGQEMPVSRPLAALEPVSTAPKAIAWPKPGTTSHRVWEIADTGLPRAEVIRRATLEGINPGTAATQFARWRRATNQ